MRSAKDGSIVTSYFTAGQWCAIRSTVIPHQIGRGGCDLRPLAPDHHQGGVDVPAVESVGQGGIGGAQADVPRQRRVEGVGAVTLGSARAISAITPARANSLHLRGWSIGRDSWHAPLNAPGPTRTTTNWDPSAASDRQRVTRPCLGHLHRFPSVVSKVATRVSKVATRELTSLVTNRRPHWCG
jgi:hypothetical protein